MRFKNRLDAGQKLARRLEEFKERNDVKLFALPRGGAVLGAEVAEALGMRFDLIVTRKIGAPYNEEYALGALAETGELIWNDETERKAQPREKLEKIIEDEKAEAKRRIAKYRGGRPLPDLAGQTVILIDDGLATGATMRAAVAAARHQSAARIIVAVPHGAQDSLAAMRRDGIEVIALEEPSMYWAVGSFYDEFGQVEDEEVMRLMREHGVR